MVFVVEGDGMEATRRSFMKLGLTVVAGTAACPLLEGTLQAFTGCSKFDRVIAGTVG